jgi:hypothetical protein
MRGVLKPGSRTVGPSLGRSTSRKAAEFQGGNMKRVVALMVLSLCMAAPSFGGDMVGHSAAVAGKDSYKAAKASAKDTGKAGKAAVKFLF